MLLEHGNIKEFENPNTLLANPDSSFHTMCKDAGLVANENGSSIGTSDSRSSPSNNGYSADVNCNGHEKTTKM